MQDFLLRSDTVDISWEHGAFLDVGDAEEAGGDALQADGKAAMRRHAVVEGLLYESESIRIHATTEHLLAVVGCSVLRSPVPPARHRRAYLPPRMAHTAPHSATPPPMRHTNQPQNLPIPPDCIKDMVSLNKECFLRAHVCII